MADEAPPRTKPLLIYDGDCTFCKAWIARWRSLTGDTVDYAPYQEVASLFSQIPFDHFKQAVHLVEPSGRITRGAEAVFHALREVPGRGWLFEAYRRLPGFAPITELSYRFVARHRPALWILTKLLWGRDLSRPTYALSRWLFLRVLGVIYLIAFASIAIQWRGLIGSSGILPASDYLAAVEQHLGPERFHRLPTLCWLSADDSVLGGLCLAGIALSAIQIIGVLQPIILLLLWAIYLSLTSVGQDFLSFQWDTLLLETGLLAILVAPRQVWPRPSREKDPPAAYRWLLWWLLFRLMFLSGITKLTYDDRTWHDLTALTYHYETQPLPTWIGWHAHQLPLWFQRLSCLIMFIIELGLPFLIVGPRRCKQLACAGIIAFMLLIAATGNYNFFNLLTITLCFTLLDDTCLRRMLPSALARRFARPGPPQRPAWWRSCIAGPIVACIILVGALEGWDEMSRRHGLPDPVRSALNGLRPFRSINGYGLFRVMTTTRPEIVMEGSNDAITWTEYAFKWKAGDISRRPAFVEPHQPRLDWQMWFAALSAPRRPPWFNLFALKLLQGAPEVSALLAANPFPDAPPRFLRAQLYDYHFTTRDERARTCAWWKRERIGSYLPIVSLPDTRPR